MQTHGTWGRRMRLHQTDSLLVTVLFLDPNERCSWHSHEHQHNLFYVVSGKLVVVTEQRAGEAPKKLATELGPKQSFLVEPHLPHEFQTRDEPTVVVEIAFVKYSVEDIERCRPGGPMTADDRVE